MDQPYLWHDTLEEAFQDVVSALGGPKKAAALLWPSLFKRSPNDAARKLSHCLDHERAEKLSFDEILLLGEKGREVNCHTIMHFLAKYWGYQDPMPLDPKTENEKLMDEYIKAVAKQEQLVKQMQQMSQLKVVGK